MTNSPATHTNHTNDRLCHGFDFRFLFTPTVRIWWKVSTMLIGSAHCLLPIFFVNSFFFSVKTWYNVTVGVLSLKTKFHIRSHYNGSFDSIETWWAHAYIWAPPSPHTHTCTIESRNCLIFSSFHRWNIYFYPLFRALASYSSIFFFCIDYIDLMAVIFVFHKCIIAYIDV